MTIDQRALIGALRDIAGIAGSIEHRAATAATYIEAGALPIPRWGAIACTHLQRARMALQWLDDSIAGWRREGIGADVEQTSPGVER